MTGDQGESCLVILRSLRISHCPATRTGHFLFLEMYYFHTIHMKLLPGVVLVGHRPSGQISPQSTQYSNGDTALELAKYHSLPLHLSR